jgi:hypothetical protein
MPVISFIQAGGFICQVQKTAARIGTWGAGIAWPGNTSAATICGGSARRNTETAAAKVSSMMRDLRGIFATTCGIQRDTVPSGQEECIGFRCQGRSSWSKIAPGSTHDHVGFSRCKSYSSYLERATGRRGTQSWQYGGEKLSAP